MKILENGIAINSPTDFHLVLENVCIFIILSKTISGVKSIDSDVRGEPLWSIVGMEGICSLVKIIIKQCGHFRITVP